MRSYCEDVVSETVVHPCHAGEGAYSVIFSAGPDFPADKAVVSTDTGNCGDETLVLDAVDTCKHDPRRDPYPGGATKAASLRFRVSALSGVGALRRGAITSECKTGHPYPYPSCQRTLLVDKWL